MLKVLDRSEYAVEMLRLLAKAGLTNAYRYDATEFALVTDGTGKLFLTNVYAEYLAASFWNRASVMRRSANQLAAINKLTLDDIQSSNAKQNLRPFIRDRMFREAIIFEDVLRGKVSHLAAARIIGEHLTLEVVLDSPTAITTPGAKILEEWGLTFDEALDIANGNLVRVSPPRFRKLRSGLFVSDFGDYYDAARMHLPQFVPRLPVQGRPVAMVPSRSVLIVTGADDADGLLEMAKLATEVLNQPRPTSGVAFRLDASWVPFLPPQGHPAHIPLRNLFLSNMATSYDMQKQILDAFHDEIGRDIFVANAMLRLFKETGIKETIAVWAKDVDTLLPEASLVAFVTSKGEPVIEAEWFRVKEEAGHLMEPQGYYPERYRVKEFPSSERMEAIGGRRLGPK